MITREYKGFTIQFHEGDETWRCEDISDKSLKAVMTAIEAKGLKAASRREVFIVQAFPHTSRVTTREATMTSVIKGARACWVVYEDGSRSQINLQDVFEVTPFNSQIVEDIETNNLAIKNLAQEMFELKARLVPIKL